MLPICLTLIISGQHSSQFPACDGLVLFLVQLGARTVAVSEEEETGGGQGMVDTGY